MPLPAVAAVLARLLPLLEGLGAEGGAAATLGRGAAAGEGGIGGLASRLFSGTKAFGSAAELGGALRKISDLQAMVEASQNAIGKNSQQREQISQKAREDERQYAFSDPGHADQLAALARQQQAQQESMRQSQRQMSDLRHRAEITTNPQAARAESFQRAATVLGAGYVASQVAPSALRTMVSNLPGVKGAGRIAEAAQNVGGFVAGPTNSNVAGQMWGAAKDVAGSAMSLNPTKLLVTLSRMPQLIENWGSALVESQRGISRFDGRLAMTFAEQERRGTIRGIESAGRTGGATSELSGTLNDLYDEIQPMRDAVTVVLSKGVTILVEKLTELVVIAKELKPYFDGLVRRVLGMTEQQYKDFIEGFAKTQRMERDRAGSQIAKGLEEALNRDKSKRIGTVRR